jgi:hypothetical protein
VEGLTMDDLQTLKERVFRMMEAGLERHRAPWIEVLNVPRNE